MHRLVMRIGAKKAAIWFAMRTMSRNSSVIFSVMIHPKKTMPSREATASPIPASPAKVERKRGRRRNGDEMGDAGGGRFLHQLETAAAGHGDEARRRDRGPARVTRAEQLVERIVAADILAHQLDTAVRRRPGGGMDGMIDPVHRLVRRQVGKGLLHGRQDQARRRCVIGAHRLHHVGDVFDAAQAAAGAAFQARARARLQRRFVDRRYRRRSRSRRAGRRHCGWRRPSVTKPSDSEKPTPKSSRSAGRRHHHGGRGRNCA